jgi:predicted transcriptional regulator
MKALSIREPWAGLIVDGKKSIELRTWRTHYRGPALIHRSGKNGGIIGSMEIVDVIKIESLEQFRTLHNKHHAPEDFFQKKLYGWIINNARPVDLIPCKGRLGLWEPSAEILKRV